MNSSHHQQLKNLLQGAGLKVSLVRLKVVEVLLRAQAQGHGLSSRALYVELQQADEQISLLTVRQVLGRLCSCGLIERHSDGCYWLLLPGAPVSLAG